MKVNYDRRIFFFAWLSLSKCNRLTEIPLRSDKSFVPDMVAHLRRICLTRMPIEFEILSLRS